MPPDRTCRSCGHVSSGDDRFCPKCGTTLPGLSAAERAEIGQAPTITVPSDPGLAPRGAPTAPEAPPAPDRLEEQLREALSPSFLLVRKLGEGGMASVYLAREPALRRLVAVKVLLPFLAADANARARFEREAQAVAGLSHPNVLGIYGLGELGDGTPYFVMQYVSGKSLAARIEEEGPLDPDEARRITGEVAAALAAAHAKGIVHRDIKPANILYDDESGRALVSDFGIAAVRVEHTEDGKTSTRLTGTGMMVGTPQYMSPEQMLAEPVTEKTDVYALGLLAYELVAGHGPFRATTPQELIAAHLRDVPRPLGELRKEVDPEFAGLVAGCLEKDASRRPTAADVAKRLSPGGGVPLEWPPPGLDALHGTLRKWSARLWLGNVLLFGIGALGFIAFGTRTLAARVSLATMLLVIATALGTVVLAVAFVELVRPLVRAAKAVRRGYTWTTVIETLADARGDTGALIAGVREYASLEPRLRSALRVSRVVREGLLFLSGLLPTPLFLVVVRLASADALPAVVTPAILLGIPILILAAALLVERTESRTFGAARAALARRRHGVDLGRLVGPWYASFEAVREGQPLGRGRTGGARYGSAGGIALAVVGVAALVAFWPLWLFAAMGSDLFLGFAPQVAGLRTRLAIADRVRPYALALDSTVTARQAGEALYVIAAGWPDSAAPRDRALLPVPRRLPPLPELTDSTLLPISDAWRGPDQTQILGLAARGFSADQRRWLEGLAAHPVWREFETLAGASSLDRYGAMLALPLPDEMTAAELMDALPPYFSLMQVLAFANTSRAALLLSQGDRAGAERVLKQTVSVGLLLANHGATALDVIIGVYVAGVGRYALQPFYSLTGRPEGEALRAFSDSLRESTDFLGAGAAGPGQQPEGTRAGYLATAADSRWPPGLRMQALGVLEVAPCTNLRELLFGPSRDVDSAFAAARRTMARTAGDSVVIGLVERQTHEGPVAREWYPLIRLGPWARAQLRAARWVGAALGARRVGACAELSLARLAELSGRR